MARGEGLPELIFWIDVIFWLMHARERNGEIVEAGNERWLCSLRAGFRLQLRQFSSTVDVLE